MTGAPALASASDGRSHAAATRYAVCACVLFTLAGDRLVFATGAGGGSGLLRLAWPALVAAALAALAFDGRTWAALGLIARRAFPWTLFIALGTALPVLGVILGQPVRILVASLTPLAAGAAALLGARATLGRADDARAASTLTHGLTLLAWVAAAAGLAQFLFYFHGSLVPWLSGLIAWDRASTLASGAQLITGRATGIYFNPNTFALLGGVLLVYALAAKVTTRERLLIATPAAVIVLLAQSRGVIAALLVAGLVELVARSRSVRVSARAVTGFFVILAIGAVGVAFLAHSAPAYFTALTGRISALGEIVAHGATSDRDLAGRVGFWGQAWQLLKTHPFGTFGPPEAALGTATDSDFVRLTLQGGFLYLASFIGALAWMFAAPGRGRWRPVLRPLSVLVLVAALTQLPTATPAFAGVVALLAGMHTGEQEEAR